MTCTCRNGLLVFDSFDRGDQFVWLVAAWVGPGGTPFSQLNKGSRVQKGIFHKFGQKCKRAEKNCRHDFNPTLRLPKPQSMLISLTFCCKIGLVCIVCIVCLVFFCERLVLSGDPARRSPFSELIPHEEMSLCMQLSTGHYR